MKNIFKFAAVAISTIYLYFFIVLPQSWSLNDDYGQIKDWAMNPNLNPWKEGFAWFLGRLKEGRFLPLDSILRLLRYKFLPIEPVYYRGVQFLLLVVAVWGILHFAKKMRFKSLQLVFLAFLVLVNLSIKEWIVLTAAAETLATPFFCLALAAYSSNKKWLGVGLFILSFLSKESFVVLGSTFFVFEYFEWKLKKKISWFPLVLLIFSALIFAIVVAKLPRVYTGGDHFLQIPLKNILVSLVFPPAKSYGVAILFVLAVCFSTKKFYPRDGLRILLVSLAIVLPISIFLVAWAGYNSWGYLQLVIPFGWAFFLAGWLPSEISPSKFRTIGAAIVVCFYIFVTLWGSLNRWSFLNESKLVADMACEDFIRDPRTKFYSSCEEGANQLQNYLMMYNRFCPHPPVILHTAGLPKDAKAPYDILIGRKWCVGDGADFDSVPKTSTYNFHSWVLIKKF